jgi:hypothetical protein
MRHLSIHKVVDRVKVFRARRRRTTEAVLHPKKGGYYEKAGVLKAPPAGLETSCS